MGVRSFTELRIKWASVCGGSRVEREASGPSE